MLFQYMKLDLLTEQKAQWYIVNNLGKGKEE